MWLSQKLSQKREEPGAARLAVTTIGGAEVGVSAGGERRNVPLFSPGGYTWRPRTGETLLVIKTGDAVCAAGTESGAAADLVAGEVRIASAGGASILLKNDGTVEISGLLTVNGVPYAAGGF